MSQYPPNQPMGQRPGQAPTMLPYATPSPVAINLRQVATAQRGIMLCILAEFIIGILRVAGVTGGVPIMVIGLTLVYFAVAIVGAVFLFKLAILLYNTGVGVVLGILTLVPLLGLIILLVINGKATNLLRQHNIKVGLMGANPATIPVDGGN